MENSIRQRKPALNEGRGKDRSQATSPATIKKSASFSDIAGDLLRSASFSPTQRFRLANRIDEPDSNAFNKTRSFAAKQNDDHEDRMKRPAKSKRNPVMRLVFFIFCIFLVCAVLLNIFVHFESGMSEFLKLVRDIVSFERIPSTAQDIPGAVVATCVCLLIVLFMDVAIVKPLFDGDAAQWFCLHAFANAFVVLGAIPDFYYVSLQPSEALSAAHCMKYSKWACSDWPTCMIIAIHLYHMLAFRLTSDDLFHHLVFVPVIGGGHFIWPWGAAGNILCFFISGLPGGVDYMLLALVKAGKVTSLTEKRINLSINVWIRAPGITTFCILAAASWLQSPDWLPEDSYNDVMPAWGFVPALLLVFYNGQYYGMRVVGNYYIRITEQSFSGADKKIRKRPTLHGC